MQLPRILDSLGYSGSRNFLRRGTAEFERAPDIGHILRAAGGKGCRLEGVYTLRPPTTDGQQNSGSIIPVVYVCKADDEAAADRIHRLVWNQDIVPFLLIHTPRGLRLYSGFERKPNGGAHTGLLEPLVEFNNLQNRLAEFHAEAIDSGELWQRRGAQIRPEARVYWSLLASLKELAGKLRAEHGLDKKIIHPLIGKYVYLHYLKDRGFLSPRRLAEWKIDAATVFGRYATFAGLRAICGKLDGFLNGRVFPLKFSGASAPKEEHIQRVAAAFAGDVFAGGWQFHLPFDAYSFTYIPIETLSMIYEQFLHTADGTDDGEDDASDEDEHTEGRKAGAYYTPIPVVNFMLAELDEHRRLERGVRVWDPSCGSGAFLVQCYRKLIERTFTPRKKPTPADLASLLKRHIFGVDMDDDACSVTEFSLYLTLLDYVQPSDLVDHPRFRLPTLRGKNIFCRDFFNTQPFKKARFHWIAGNPPWKQLKTATLEKRDERAMKWMLDPKADRPVGKYALAQAFAWRCREFLHHDGVCALLLPAMTLFEDSSREFRKMFFRDHRIHSVANFSNLTEVLFAGRARVPAAAFCFGLTRKNEPHDDLERTTVFSPLIANQEATRPLTTGVRNETWSLVVNGDEIRELPYCEIASGSGLPWKLATWGSALDEGLLTRLRGKFNSMEKLAADWKKEAKEFAYDSSSGKIFGIAEGLQLRPKDGSRIRRRNKSAINEQLESVPEVEDKPRLVMSKLECVRRVFSFDGTMTESVPTDETWGRKGRTSLALAVCRGPHVVVGENRTFATFVPDFMVVPGRQIGIVAAPGKDDLLKALALFLSSDFTFYHEFFVSPCFGVKRPISTLSALRKLPCPLPQLGKAELREWAELYDELAETSVHRVQKKAPAAEFFGFSSERQKELIRQLNEKVEQALGFDAAESALIHDLIHVRFGLDDGDQDQSAMAPAPVAELRTYAEWLRRELDAQADEESPRHHAVSVLYDGRSGFVSIESTTDRTAAARVRIMRAGREDAEALARTRAGLREEAAQWVYFDRALRIHRPRKVYLFKPIHRMHWTRSRALLDAADIHIGTPGSTRDA